VIHINRLNKIIFTVLDSIINCASEILISPSVHILRHKLFCLHFLFKWLEINRVRYESFFVLSYFQTYYFDIPFSCYFILHLLEGQILHKILKFNIRMGPFYNISFNSEKIGILFIGSSCDSYFVIFTSFCYLIKLHLCQQLFIPKYLWTFINIFIWIVIIFWLWTWRRISSSFISILSIFFLSLFFFIILILLSFIPNRFCFFLFWNHLLNVNLVERSKIFFINILLIGDSINSRRILRKIPSAKINMLKPWWVQIIIFLRFENKPIDFPLQM